LTTPILLFLLVLFNILYINLSDLLFDSLCVKQTTIVVLCRWVCVSVFFKHPFVCGTYLKDKEKGLPSFSGILRLIVVTDIWQRSWSSLVFFTYLLFLFCISFQYYTFYCLPISREKSSVTRSCVCSIVIVANFQRSSFFLSLVFFEKQIGEINYLLCI